MSTVPQPAMELLQQRQALLARLAESRDRIMAVLADVSDELSRIGPSQNAWSVLDCAEHVALAERGMFSALEKRRPSAGTPDASRDTAIRTLALDRSRTFPSPEVVRPNGRFPTLADAIDDFRLARERTMIYLESVNEDLRQSSARHPLGTFDSYQFVLIMALHAERHALQIEEIKNSPAYQAALNQERTRS